MSNEKTGQFIHELETLVGTYKMFVSIPSTNPDYTTKDKLEKSIQAMSNLIVATASAVSITQEGKSNE